MGSRIEGNRTDGDEEADLLTEELDRDWYLSWDGRYGEAKDWFKSSRPDHLIFTGFRPLNFSRIPSMEFIFLLYAPMSKPSGGELRHEALIHAGRTTIFFGSRSGLILERRGVHRQR